MRAFLRTDNLENPMSGNTIGKLFTVTTFGESHGAALGCIVDGCPPGLCLTWIGANRVSHAIPRSDVKVIR